MKHFSPIEMKPTISQDLHWGFEPYSRQTQKQWTQMDHGIPYSNEQENKKARKGLTTRDFDGLDVMKIFCHH